MVDLVAVVIPAVAVLVLVLVGRLLATRSSRHRVRVYELRFPSQLDTEAVKAFLRSLTGLLPPRWQRLLSSSPAVAFEVIATTSGIRHRLVVPERVHGYVMAQLAATLPQVAVVEVTDRPQRPDLAAELAITDVRRPLAVERPEGVAASFLASYLPLHRHERVHASWLVTPHPPVSPIKPPSRAASNGLRLTDDLGVALRDSESVRAARAKQASPVFLAVGRLGVTAADASRRRALMRRLLGAFHSLNAPGVHLRRRALPSWIVAARVERSSLPAFEYPVVVNVDELAALIAWPLGSPRLPGLEQLLHQVYEPSKAIPTSGRVVAQSTYPGTDRTLALSTTDSLRNMWLTGPTGVGKSAALGSLILQDVEANRSVVVFDPKGDLIADVLDRIPAHRVRDVILLDPSDDSRPVPFNPLANAHRNPELIADQVLHTFSRLYKAYWGPRTADVLHACLLTLASQPGSTLVDIPTLLINPVARRQFVGAVDDFVLRQFWAGYEAMSAGERTQAIAPLLNKVRPFVMRPRLRAMLGQPEPTFTMEEVINGGKVLLISLPAGLIGEEASALVGTLALARLWQAIQGRAGTAADRRRPVFCYVDEFQGVAALPTSLGDILAQTRGLAAGFVLANQHPGQLSAEIRQAVSANCRSKLVFQTSAADAPAMARELGVRPEDLTALPVFEVVATLVANGQVQPPASGRTLGWPPPTGQAAAVRAASRARYGRDRAEVEAAIRARQEGPRPEGSTLRKPRGES
ncbi:MAG: type IV secretory system conjugative DNA transfer family protein [Acidimicrobiales bacterium]